MSTAPLHVPDPAELAQRCRAAGLRVTPQRIAVFSALASTTSHPSPERLHHAVCEFMPTISLATIYKTLDALVEAGLVQEVSAPSLARRFDARTEPHHHLVCTACERVMDSDDPTLNVALPQVPGFVASSVKVTVLGVCASCAERAS